MTLEERTERIYTRLLRASLVTHRDLILGELTAAVEEEREERAKIADGFANSWAAAAEKEISPGLKLSLLARAEGARIIAQEIRARSEANDESE